MQLFRKLAKNIFFKIILAFVALSFVLFGVSEFLLNSPNSWVAKIGDKTISQNSFNKAMQADREMILNSTKSEEALKYLDSTQFKSDVLGRMVNKIMIEKLHDHFGAQASKDLVLQAIAKDENFKNKDGKFDHQSFKNFLAKHGLNEEKYVSEIVNEITATMIIQSLVMTAPLNENLVLQAENFKEEKRLADLITISATNVKNLPAANDEEITKFFEKNKQNYALPETRKVSYLHFSKQNFAKDFQVAEAEIFAEYEKNKEQFQKPESRNFYHLLFDDETSAKSFLQKLTEATKSDKSKLNSQFLQLAKTLTKKDKKAVTLSNVAKKDLIPELAEAAFSLALNQHSDAIKSPLGFHIFLLTEIKKPQLIAFSEVKNSIKEKLLSGRQEKVLQEKISAIDDLLLTSNSLLEVAKKFDLKMVNPPVKIDQNGKDENGEMVLEIKGFSGFVENAFALAAGQTSKIFYAKNSEGFYALKVEEIAAAHDRNLSEVKSRVVQDLLAKRKDEALRILAKKIQDELKSNPQKSAEIVAKYQLKIEKNREFPRIFYINFQGRNVPYDNEFLTELFTLKTGQITTAISTAPQEFIIGILREIKKPAANSIDFERLKKTAGENFKTELLQEFNSYLLKKNPVKVNEKILGEKE